MTRDDHSLKHSSGTTRASYLEHNMQADLSHNNASSRTVSVDDAPGPLGPIDLPLRELSDNADLEEYTRETTEGEIAKQVTSAAGKTEDYKLVTFKIDDPENPKNWSKAFKWYITMVIAFTCFVVALARSIVTADLPGVMQSFGVSREVTLLTVTVFVIGFGVGKFTSDQVFPGRDANGVKGPWHLPQCQKCSDDDRSMESRWESPLFS